MLIVHSPLQALCCDGRVLRFSLLLINTLVLVLSLFLLSSSSCPHERVRDLRLRLLNIAFENRTCSCVVSSRSLLDRRSFYASRIPFLHSNNVGISQQTISSSPWPCCCSLSETSAFSGVQIRRSSILEDLRNPPLVVCRLQVPDLYHPPFRLPPLRSRTGPHHPHRVRPPSHS